MFVKLSRVRMDLIKKLSRKTFLQVNKGIIGEQRSGLLEKFENLTMENNLLQFYSISDPILCQK